MRGGNLPALADAAAAGRFTARHGGRAMRFAQLARELPPELQRLAPYRH
jgi:nitrous oxide reductase accessory protein NosL